MSRQNLTPELRTALQAAHVTSFLLLQLDLDSGTQRLVALPFDVELLGHTWLHAQHVGTVEPITETAAHAAGMAFTLSGVPEAAIAGALTEPVQGRTATLLLAVVDGDAVRIDPVAWRGTLDRPTIVDGGATAQIRVTAEHALLRWSEPTGQRFADADHQASHPGDLFFQFAAQVAEDTLVWPGKEFFKR